MSIAEAAAESETGKSKLSPTHSITYDALLCYFYNKQAANIKIFHN
jgi:hypothetical protein